MRASPHPHTQAGTQPRIRELSKRERETERQRSRDKRCAHMIATAHSVTSRQESNQGKRGKQTPTTRDGAETTTRLKRVHEGSKDGKDNDTKKGHRSTRRRGIYKRKHTHTHTHEVDKCLRKRERWGNGRGVQARTRTHTKNVRGPTRSWHTGVPCSGSSNRGRENSSSSTTRRRRVARKVSRAQHGGNTHTHAWKTTRQTDRQRERRA